MCNCVERSEKTRLAIEALKCGDLPGMRRELAAIAASIAQDLRGLAGIER